jgi:hypothetical protein
LKIIFDVRENTKHLEGVVEGPASDLNEATKAFEVKEIRNENKENEIDYAVRVLNCNNGIKVDDKVVEVKKESVNEDSIKETDKLIVNEPVREVEVVDAVADNVNVKETVGVNEMVPETAEIKELDNMNLIV